MTSREFIAQSERLQAFQLTAVSNTDNFPVTLSIIEFFIIRLLFLAGTMNLCHIMNITKEIVTESELNVALSKLCQDTILWCDKDVYSLGRKGVGLFVPKDMDRGYKKMAISESEKLRYYLKGSIISQICDNMKLDPTLSKVAKTQAIANNLLIRPTTLLRFGERNIYKMLDAQKNTIPYIDIFHKVEIATARRADMSGAFSALARKVKNLKEDDIEKDNILLEYNSFELNLKLIEYKISQYTEKAPILATFDDDGVPHSKLIYPKILTDNGIFITNCKANENIHLTFAIIDNLAEHIGVGLLFTRLCLVEALVRSLSAVRPIYRLVTTDRAAGEAAISGVIERCKRAEYNRYFPLIETQLKILEV